MPTGPPVPMAQGRPLSETTRLRLLLDETVTVLDRTRHAFKSRELGRLRRRLEQALEELSGPA